MTEVFSEQVRIGILYLSKLNRDLIPHTKCHITNMFSDVNNQENTCIGICSPPSLRDKKITIVLLPSTSFNRTSGMLTNFPPSL